MVSFDLKEMEAFSRRHQNLIERILVTLYILSSGGPRLISSLPMNRARVRVWVLASAVYFYSRQVLRFFSFNDEVYSKSGDSLAFSFFLSFFFFLFNINQTI